MPATSASAAQGRSGRSFALRFSQSAFEDLSSPPARVGVSRCLFQRRQASFDVFQSPSTWDPTRCLQPGRVDAGALACTISFSTVVTAALEACCSRAIDCENARRLAARYAASNFGSFIQRRSVLAETFTAPAASSMFRCVRSAAIASSFFRPNFAP